MAAQTDAPTPISYFAAAVSGALVALLVGYLALDAARSKTAPRIGVQIVGAEMRNADGRTYVPIEVVNEGDRSATEVVVETESAGAPEAPTQTVIDYMAGGEARRIVAVVPSAPGVAFHVRIVSYQEP
jgi:uncharacterized protein (TIGR02588 family)